MDENLTQDQKLNELVNRQHDITSKINNADMQKNSIMVEEAAIKQKIAELQKQLEDLNNKRQSLDLKMSQIDADKISNTVELEEIQEEITKIEEEKKSEFEKTPVENVDIAEYTQLLTSYNKDLEAYNKDVPKLYNLQRQYEQGKIEYDEYEKFATPLANRYITLQKEYEKLCKLYEKLNNQKANSSLESLTDEQLKEKLSSLNNELKNEWHYGAHETNGMEEIDTSRFDKIQADIKAIKVEQDRRLARTFSNDELTNNIKQLNATLAAGTEQNPVNVNKIKSILTLLNAEQEERNKRPASIYTDEQLDAKLAELNEAYMDEWNYSAHESNGMEANDPAKLDKIKEQIDALNAEKAARINNGVSKLEIPKAPQKVMFISPMKQKGDKEPPTPQPSTDNSLGDNEQEIDNRTAYPGRPHITLEDAEKMPREQYEHFNNLSNEHYNGSSLKRLASRIKEFFSKSKTKALSSGISPSELKDAPQKSVNSDEYEPKINFNPYFKELQDAYPSTIKDSSGNITIDVFSPDNAPIRQVKPEGKVDQDRTDR